MLTHDDPRQLKEAMNILAVLQMEVDAVNNVLITHQDSSVIYSQLPDVSVNLQQITWNRPMGIPSYLERAMLNWDHFGDHARSTYIAGHAIVIQKAISGDLEGAYAMNVFVDHFLVDLFSSCHLRTPRRSLHGDMKLKSRYLCQDSLTVFCKPRSNYNVTWHMHDGAVLLGYQNPSGQSWIMYGDKRPLDTVNKENMGYCGKAVQVSAAEIYEVCKTKQTSPANYEDIPNPTHTLKHKARHTCEKHDTLTGSAT